MGLTSNLGKLSSIITSTGSAVGIGTSSPQSGYILDVKGFSQFGNSIYPNVIRLGDQDTNSTIIQSVSTAGVAKNMTFWNTSERMRINSSGNVSISNTNDTYKLDITGTLRTTATIYAQGSGGQIQIGGVGTGALSGIFQGNNSNVLFIGDWNTATKGINIDVGSGNVGIGTSTPSALLHLIQNTTNLNLYLQNTNGSGKTWSLNSDNAGKFNIHDTIANRITINSLGNVGIGTTNPVIAGTGFVGLSIYGVNGSSFVLTSGSGSHTYLYTPNNTDFSIENAGAQIFRAGSSERMRIFANGNVAVGTSTDTTFRFTSQGEILSDGDSAALFVQARDLSTRYAWYASNSTYLNFYNTGNGVTGQFTRTNGAYTALSDVNKKKDFEDSTIGLNAILGLKPTLFRMKDESDEVEKQLGFIAQEVKEFIPQAYIENGDFIGLQDRPIIAALVKSIQEQQKQIEELKSLIKK